MWLVRWKMPIRLPPKSSESAFWYVDPVLKYSRTFEYAAFLCSIPQSLRFCGSPACSVSPSKNSDSDDFERSLCEYSLSFNWCYK
jgi:hypothetical protein